MQLKIPQTKRGLLVKRLTESLPTKFINRKKPRSKFILRRRKREKRFPYSLPKLMFGLNQPIRYVFIIMGQSHALTIKMQSFLLRLKVIVVKKKVKA